jgi:hypothetical protein
VIPFLAHAAMRTYVAVFGRQAAQFHLSRILTALNVMDSIGERVTGMEDDDESGDDAEDGRPMGRTVRRTTRKASPSRLRPWWGQVARAAWRASEPKDGAA